MHLFAADSVSVMQWPLLMHFSHLYVFTLILSLRHHAARDLHLCRAGRHADRCVLTERIPTNFRH